MRPTRRSRAATGRLAYLLRILGLTLACFYGVCALGLVLLRWIDPVITAVQIQRAVQSLIRLQVPHRLSVHVPLERISDHLEHAVVASEDARFFRHHGIDQEEMRRALQENWRRGRLWRGGSTITQQLVKNLYLSTHRSLVRKAVEIPLALAADALLDKRRILELYLNVVEWGPGIYGAEAAARHHFGVAAGELTRGQAIGLAAVLPAPSSRDPRRSGRYASVIDRRMRQMGW